MEETGLQAGAGLSLNFEAAQKALFASSVPDLRSAPIDEAWLLAQIEKLGYGALRYLPMAGSGLIARYNSGQPVAAVRLAEMVDASLKVSISADQLEAILDIQPAQGGATITKVAVLEALAAQGIAEGVLLDTINTAIAEGSAQGAVIARGRAPVAGEDGRLESLIPEVRSRVPRVDETGHTDYRDLGEIFVVHVGDALMRRHPATAGTDGASVLRVPIAAKPGKDVMFSGSLSGVSFAPDNPNLLLAAINGQPVQVKGGMNVEPVFSVDEVSMTSGHIEFDGNVVIRGDVATGMKVKATGDIEVGGVVEAATLEAGGSIVIKGGVLGSVGRKDGGDEHIRCGACFNAAYAQQARIDAGDSIFIDDMAMQCELSAVNHIRVGHKKRGYIIGGKAQATLSITAKVIGSPNRVSTQFEIGVNPNMHKLMLEMAHKRNDKEDRLLEISKLLDFAAKHPEKVRPDMIEKARHSAEMVSHEIAALREEEDALMHKIVLSQQSRVIAEQLMYEGVIVHLGSHRYRVVGEQGAGAICLDKHGLVISALDGTKMVE